MPWVEAINTIKKKNFALPKLAGSNMPTTATIVVQFIWLLLLKIHYSKGNIYVDIRGAVARHTVVFNGLL